MTRALVLADFDAIARGQLACEASATPHANRVLVCDTEPHTTCTWSDMIAGGRPDWLTASARAQPYDLFLVFGDDLPWVDDGTRMLGDRRGEHRRRLLAELDAANRRRMTITGGGDARVAAAVAAVAAVRAATGWPRS